MDEETPLRLAILILNISPDPEIRLDDLMTVYGRGGDDLGEIITQGLLWTGPVILGERFISPP